MDDFPSKQYAFPSDYDPDNCIFICIPCDLVPLITGKISELEHPTAWRTRDDYEQGAAAIVAWGAQLMACSDRITNRLDQIIAALGYAAGLPAGDPAYDPTDTQRAALDRVRTGLSASGTITLDDVIQYINQLETYVYGLVDVIGDHDLDPPVPE